MIIMTEEYWANSQFSIARYYGGIEINGHRFEIVNSRGMNLFECSLEADKLGREKAIPAGEPADLVRWDFIPLYKKLGRDQFIKTVQENNSATDKELKLIMKGIKQ